MLKYLKKKLKIFKLYIKNRNKSKDMRMTIYAEEGLLTFEEYQRYIEKKFDVYVGGK